MVLQQRVPGYKPEGGRHERLIQNSNDNLSIESTDHRLIPEESSQEEKGNRDAHLVEDDKVWA